MTLSLPTPLRELVERSAAPRHVEVTLLRLAEVFPDAVERLTEGRWPSPLARTLVVVASASNSLSRLCTTDPRALDVLDDLQAKIGVDAGDAKSLARAKRLELLRIAARDLCGMDSLDEVGANLAAMASAVLQGSLELASASRNAGTALSVIGMGKLGGRELNYASDVDILFVGHRARSEAGDTDDVGLGGELDVADLGASAEELARRVLEVARGCFRVDAGLRPEGRAGPLARSLDSYQSYWDRWARTWEFQALIKARSVAGDRALGRRFEQAAAAEVWGRTYSAEELGEVRSMKARAESIVRRRGLAGRELKRGPGGIRDVEFAVQLLQLVHGRLDPAIRGRSTLGTLRELAGAGYVDSDDARVLARAYRFLRTVEHRLQLVEEEQVHAVPSGAEARRRLALVLGFEDDASTDATARFEEALRLCLRDVRVIHERLFFRPLLEAFAEIESASGRGGEERSQSSPARAAEGGMSSEAISARLAAFGFAGPRRTRAAVTELAGGLTRSSRLMSQMLPLLLDWLSLSPDPDLGLLGLRNMVVKGHQRSLLVSTFRDSPEAARRLCLLMGSSRILVEAIERNPELIPELDDDAALLPAPRSTLVAEASNRLARLEKEDQSARRAQLVRLRQDHFVRIAARDLLGLDDVAETGRALSELAEALIESALASIEARVPFCVFGLGRLGGGELSYASDLDLVFVAGDGSASELADETAERLLFALVGDSPSERVWTVDLGLRPEGGQGRMARDLSAYETYFQRWGQTWERQAMLRARFIAGDPALGTAFADRVHDFVWERGLSDEDAAAIRRMKARVERERIPAREDPQFHLKLGRGSLADIEWTAQLLQMRHRVEATSTVQALRALAARGWIDPDDRDVLLEAYRFCERTRNHWYLVGALPGGGSPGDSLPSQPDQLARLARSLETTPGELRSEFRRVTRRSRRVVERLFYGIG